MGKKKLMINKGLTVPKALAVLIINIIITALTFWQTANYELSVGIFVGIILVILPLVLNYTETTPEPSV